MFNVHTNEYICYKCIFLELSLSQQKHILLDTVFHDYSIVSSSYINGNFLKTNNT